MLSDVKHNGSSQRLLDLIERLLELPAADLRTTLNQTADYVQGVLGADKVDAFLYVPAKNLLCARGTSDTPLGRLQLEQGLDVLPVANGGSVADVFTSGQPHITGHADQLTSEVPGLVRVLGIRSHIAVAIEVAGKRRGVLSVQSRESEFFTAEDLHFLTAVARWTGALTHRAELVEATTAAAVVRGRQSAADELLLVLAHDLHNHLTPLRWRIELLRMNAEQDHRDRDVNDADTALRGIERLASLVTDLLDVGRLDQGLFEVQPVPLDLTALARAASQELGTDQVAVHVEGPPELFIAADPDRIRQVLENLIGNAVKHSPKGKSVCIQLRTEMESISARRMAVVEVNDEGPGVPPDVLPRLFERFVKGSRSKGLGLGLYLAKRIVEAHGGELTVHSAPGQGASFRVRIPAEDSREE